MRILLIHNYYGSSAPSGENKVFEAERAMLEKHGHEVEVYARYSDDIRNVKVCKYENMKTANSKFGVGCFHTSIFSLFHTLKGMVKGALCTIGNPFAARAVAKKCREFKPDVVHFHNTFPLISPLAVRAASKYAPVVMTLHNYRAACAAGVPTRDGKVCSLCLDKKCVWFGIKHRCYRGSLAATLPLVINIALYRRRLPKWVTKFIVLSEFQKRKMVEYGWSEEKIVVKGNFVGRVEHIERVEKKNQIVYAGRLSPEKGVETLIETWRVMGSDSPLLLIAGDGDYRAEYESHAVGLNILFLGQLPHDQMLDLVSQSKCIIQPSVCWETFGLAAVEAMTVGVPSVVANVGGLPDIIQGGRFGEIFESGNPESCAVAIMRLLSRPDYDEICKAVAQEAQCKYSEQANCAQLINIYVESVRCSRFAD